MYTYIYIHTYTHFYWPISYNYMCIDYKVRDETFSGKGAPITKAPLGLSGTRFLLKTSSLFL